MDLHLITVPYRYDEHRQGLGKGPDALLEAGLERGLAERGVGIAHRAEASIDESARQPGRTAVNIGTLGAATAELVSEARRQGGRCLILAGDDTAAIGVISGLQQAHGAAARIGVVWLDAHGDFNTPETSYSGILAGMSLAIVAGLAGPNWREAARMAAPVPTNRIVIAGVRQLDPKEHALLDVTDVSMVTSSDMRESDRWEAAIARLHQFADIWSVHVDTDVLDDRLVPSSTTPSRGGLEIDELARALTALLETGKVAALTVCNVNPGGGARGRRSIESTLRVLGEALPAWQETPPAASPA